MLAQFNSYENVASASSQTANDLSAIFSSLFGATSGG